MYQLGLLFVYSEPQQLHEQIVQITKNVNVSLIYFWQEIKISDWMIILQRLDFSQFISMFIKSKPSDNK